MRAVPPACGPYFADTLTADRAALTSTDDACANPGGRSVYAPDGTGVWRWVRDMPWDAM
ncbi:hypothetical protein [Streptomyces sp. NPDC095613]|uniref:hypothetical protein n=1 Tax=Streptomyces sp. NPDC095613 TaxID=3155540 RepID=UPI0033236F77